jgi:hypothetical protein
LGSKSLSEEASVRSLLVESPGIQNSNKTKTTLLVIVSSSTELKESIGWNLISPLHCLNFLPLLLEEPEEEPGTSILDLIPKTIEKGGWFINLINLAKLSASLVDSIFQTTLFSLFICCDSSELVVSTARWLHSIYSIRGRKRSGKLAGKASNRTHTKEPRQPNQTQKTAPSLNPRI